MTPYELKKLQCEYKNVNAARETQELRLFEIMDQVEKMQKSIDISKAKEDELLAKLKEATSN